MSSRLSELQFNNFENSRALASFNDGILPFICIGFLFHIIDVHTSEKGKFNAILECELKIATKSDIKHCELDSEIKYTSVEALNALVLYWKQKVVI